MKLIFPPAKQPIELEEAKLHLRVDVNEDDRLIEALIKAGTKYAEKFMGRALVDQTWDHYLDAFPTGYIEIPRPPLIEVIGVFYMSGSETEFTDYVVDDASEPARVYLPASGTWPTVDNQRNAVRIRFRAGYVDYSSSPPGDVPEDIKAAILIYIATLYNFREALGKGSELDISPWGAEQILRQYNVEKSMA